MFTSGSPVELSNVKLFVYSQILYYDKDPSDILSELSNATSPGKEIRLLIGDIEKVDKILEKVTTKIQPSSNSIVASTDVSLDFLILLMIVFSDVITVNDKYTVDQITMHLIYCTCLRVQRCNHVM